VTSPISEALDALKKQYGGSYQIWYVPHATDGGMTWCARRWDADYSHNLHAETADGLAQVIAEAEAD
jgi:hypothetical protein